MNNLFGFIRKEIIHGAPIIVLDASAGARARTVSGMSRLRRHLCTSLLMLSADSLAVQTSSLQY